jgi:hypothetical protein
MQQPVEAPTPEALADLVARCAQINRFTTQLTAIEEAKIAALASSILVMRGVLALPAIKSERLPARQRRIQHWSLTAGGAARCVTPAVQRVHGTLVLDEHEQVKILSNRTWRGVWREVTLWRDGVHGLAARDLMSFLAVLVAQAQERAPQAAQALHDRSVSVANVDALLPGGPRSR